MKWSVLSDQFKPTKTIDTSPIIPLPPPSSSSSSPSFSSTSSPPPTLTRRQLHRLFQGWLKRESSLIVRLHALEAATMRNQSSCWAGNVEERARVRPARAEAKFMVRTLGKALEWCDGEIVSRAKNGETIRTFHKIPPSFQTSIGRLTLPIPIPLAPPPLSFDLVIPILPTFESAIGGEGGLPEYHEVADEEGGERSLGMSMLRRLTPRVISSGWRN